MDKISYFLPIRALSLFSQLITGTFWSEFLKMWFVIKISNIRITQGCSRTCPSLPSPISTDSETLVGGEGMFWGPTICLLTSHCQLNKSYFSGDALKGRRSNYRWGENERRGSRHSSSGQFFLELAVPEHIGRRWQLEWGEARCEVTEGLRVISVYVCSGAIKLVLHLNNQRMHRIL